MAPDRRVARGRKTTPDNCHGRAVIVQPTRDDSNPHRIAGSRAPNRYPRGFLPWGLSDACPIKFRSSSRELWWWAGIRQPLTGTVVMPGRLSARSWRLPGAAMSYLETLAAVKIHRLYEQKQTALERAAVLDEYLRRWLRWTTAGLAGLG
jgi:hypothetical protein